MDSSNIYTTNNCNTGCRYRGLRNRGGSCISSGSICQMTRFIINRGARKIIKRFIFFMVTTKLYEINTICIKSYKGWIKKFFTDHTYDVTGRRSWEDSHSRGAEIKVWMVQHSELENYVIIDGH